MNKTDVVKVLMAVKSSPFNSPKPVSIPGWDSNRSSSGIAYCVDAGLVRAKDVTNLQSPHREYILPEITSKGEDYLENNS
jgi:hypothetical protein